MRGLVNVPFAQRRHTVDRGNPARAHRLLDKLARHIRAYRGEPKVKPFLARDVADHDEGLFEVGRCTRRAGGAD